ncbi:hypothetical protein [Acidisoma silvae]|uniref:Nucleotide-diphospho-sugar transferase domain-containing protein n=1 Tax=Acidisoma silvae TaxID=2802396 RepID=A0A963YV03_9PROT|nr:hypothetical protein [Acidisoma silvae]MCB8877566.1 hypothetical protein [Acidisoma silvae]
MEKIKAFQTANAENYAQMLDITSKNNRSYFDSIGVPFETFVGLKRGYYPWHACFNRIVYLKEQLELGYNGWIFYLDADAFVYDHSFNLMKFLKNTPGNAIFSPGGLTGHKWDVNDGVFLIDLASDRGRRLAEAWYRHFMSTPDSQLQNAKEWQMVPSDQPRLHQILQTNPDLLEGVTLVARELFNNEKASFIRQVLRSNAKSFDERMERIKEEVGNIISK